MLRAVKKKESNSRRWYHVTSLSEKLIWFIEFSLVAKMILSVFSVYLYLFNDTLDDMIDLPAKIINEAVDSMNVDKSSEKQQESLAEEQQQESLAEEQQQESNSVPILSEKRKALFEPLEPAMNINGKRPSAESLLPPPDFESASYPKGWLIGKKRKLVNVDVVESMRRIAVQEMNRKDREIDGLNEQLEGDARCLEHLQMQLLEERSKRTAVERQNEMLQNQIGMLMDMLQENEAVDEDDDEGTKGN